jgi:hypothetical protein
MKPKNKQRHHVELMRRVDVANRTLEEMKKNRALRKKPTLNPSTMKGWVMTPNMEGWERLIQILDAARKEEKILSSASAAEFVDTVLTIALNTGFKLLNGEVEPTDESVGGIKAFLPLGPELSGEHLGHYNGRENGGKTMERRADEHANLLKKSVEDLLKNPSTADWSDRNIARWLMEEPRALHKAKARAKKPKDSKKPNELSEKTMTTRVKEIRAAYKASI